MPYHQLTAPEREIISQMTYAGDGPTKIGKRLNRHPGTITRELQRNSETIRSPHSTRRIYSAIEADQLAKDRRRSGPPARKIDQKKELKSAVLRGLKDRWSPEQIAGQLQETHRKDRSRRVCCQTIYTWIHANLLQTPELKKQLRRRGKRYQYGRRSFRGRFVNRRKIEDRPRIVDRRSRVGDWEGDTVHGKGRSGFLATYVDRKSGFLMACKLPNLEARRLTDKSLQLFRRIDKTKIETLTLDNGVEFSDHARLERLTPLKVWFARPYCSSDRATNENTNGLLRDYFPKGMDFSKITHQQLAKVVKEINNRPRKRLNYKTPNDVFHS